MSIKTGLEYVGYIDPWTDEERLSDEEIVRCRDCKHYVPEYGYSEERGFGQIEYLMEPPGCARSKAIQITVDPNGFCAWGERRD